MKGTGAAHHFEVFALVKDVLVAGDDVEAVRIPFGAGAIIGHEHDESVFELTVALEVFDDPADLLVHAVDHGRVDRHSAGEIGAPICRQAVPCGVGAGLGLAVVPPLGARRKLCFFGDDAEFLHSRQALFAEFVPADGKTVGVFFDLGLWSVEREMRGRVSEVEKPGLIGCLPSELQKIKGMIGDRIGGVKFPFGIASGLAALGQAQEMLGIEESLGAGQCAVKLLEAMPGGILGAEVPLAGDEGSIAGRLQGFSECLGLLGDAAAVAGATDVLGHVAEADTMGILASQNGGAGRAAAAGVVELRQSNPALGERVEIWRVDAGTIAAEVGIAEVVGNDDQQVGRIGGIGGGA